MRLVALFLAFALAYALTPITVHDLHAMKRVSGLVVSPDGTTGVYSVRYWNEATGITDTHLEKVTISTGATSAITTNLGAVSTSENSPAFSPDGNVVAFQGDDDNSIYQVDMQSGEASILATLPVPVTSFKWAPTGDYIIFSAKVYVNCSTPSSVLDCTAQLTATVAAAEPNTGYTFTRLYVRHWDTWETEGMYSHLFKLNVAKQGRTYRAAAGPVLDIMPQMMLAAPVPPFGGVEQYDISPDGKEVAFTAETIEHDTAWKTGWKIYTVNVETNNFAPIWITSFTSARCQDPEYSPNGNTLAYLAMARSGLESDRLHINLVDRSTGNLRQDIVPAWDRSVAAYTWSLDSTYVLVDFDEDGRHKLATITTSTTPVVSTIQQNGHSGNQLPVPGSTKWVVVADSMSAPPDVYSFNLPTPSALTGWTQITQYNKDLLSGLWLGVTETFYFPSNGDIIQGWIIKPFGYDPASTWPLAQLIHGGPEGAWLDSWSWRWNPQLWAAAGYFTIAINPHGSTGQGQNFTDAVRYDWGGVPFQDLMTGNDYITKSYPSVDPKRMAACGASYGGFMINWINGHDHRFRALVCHDGLFSAMGMYYSSEEVFFNEAEFGPPPFYGEEQRNAYEKWSPENFVQNWVTPTLIVHGGKDYRIPVTEGLGAFTALQRKGVDSKLLHFPEENHWVLKSANSIMWYDNVLGWLNTHTN